jgi:hypothetical protein
MPTGAISSRRMKMIGPSAGRSTLATSSVLEILSLVRHIETMAGTMMRAPSVMARTELPGLWPRSTPRARPKSRISRLMKYHQKT